MKLSEVLAMVLIAAAVFILVLLFSVIYSYVTNGDFELVQLMLAVVVAVLGFVVAGLRRSVKEAERIALRRELEE